MPPPSLPRVSAPWPNSFTETIQNSNIKNVLQSSLNTLYKQEYKNQFREFTLYNVDLWLITYEKDLADERHQQPAFVDPIVAEPQGARLTQRGTVAASSADSLDL